MNKTWLIACALVVCASTARADVVADWNIQTGRSVGVASTPGTLPTARRGPSNLFDFATVHAAMHDAVQAYEGRFESYCADIPDVSGSPIAAAAAAAHGVLVALFPGQRADLDTALDASLATYGLTGSDGGVSAGQRAAACVMVKRAGDTHARSAPDWFMGGNSPGEWRPTSSNQTTGAPLPMTAGFVGTFAPFTLKAPDQFRASQPPPHLTSGHYARDYDEVKSLGSNNSTTRTPEQTRIARFFSDGPPSYWNGTVRTLTTTHALSLGDSARLFALVNMSMADAIISSWDSKVAWNFWRPITAIREGERDGNPRTEGQDGWTPFAGTPNYPDYTSGANNLSGAATGALRNFFGTDDLAFTLTSATAGVGNPTTRTYTRLSDACRDVVDARIYMGIHFRFADTVALRQGTHVANWAFGHFLRPITD